MKKTRLFMSIIGMCFALAVLTFGVFAATEMSYGFSGTIAYTVKDAYVSVSSKVYQYTAGELTRAEMIALGDEIVDSEPNDMPEGILDLNNTNTYTTQGNVGNTTHAYGDLAFLIPETQQDTGAYAYFFVVTVSNLSASVNVWAIDTSDINIDNIILYSNDNQDIIAKDSPKNIVIGVTVEDWKVSIPKVNFNMSVSIGAGVSPETPENMWAQEENNLEKLIFTYDEVNQSYSVKLNPAHKTGELYIPITYNGYPVTVVDACDYENNTFEYTKIVIPGSVKTIKAYGFAKCINLTELVIPRGVQTVGEYAFLGCVSLEKLSIPSTVTTLPTNCLYQCESIYKFELTKGVTTVMRTLIKEYSTVTHIEVEYGIKSLPNEAFRECTNITHVVLPETITSVGGYAFYGCSSLQVINLPQSITIINERTFGNCQRLKTVNIPAGVKTIGAQAFFQSGIKYIEIPDATTSFGGEAFAGGCSIDKFIMGIGITSVPDRIFQFSSIGRLYYKGTAEQYSIITITGDYNGCLKSSSNRYYYSETQPEDLSGNYWHFVNGVPVEW